MKRTIAFAALLVLPFAAVCAPDTLPDPTRPPGNWIPGQPAAAEGGGGNRLQSVILPRRGKPAAIIDGARVELGGMHGDSQVIRITESEVVLKGPAGLETLKMVPGVDKRVKPAVHKNKAAREDRP